ncbi:gram-negative bacteria-binding protein [Niveomyces insectorum RCEF 264]|uniref:Gram-negative bacteria-binding protein n=1 Tax=Niveomyces insectorum RCEF 264 TaxID=1081102 RepID=A0A167T5U4_9HYPO|nr:gram-negative bacteria-binding protein [Niveomyces insectorum RCEF 264]
MKEKGLSPSQTGPGPATENAPIEPEPSRHPSTQLPSVSLNDAADGKGNGVLHDGAESVRSAASAPGLHPGLDPLTSAVPTSRPPSTASFSVLGARFDEQAQRYFHSRRVRKGEVSKPWLGRKDPKEKWATIMPLIGILTGLAISGVLVWDGLRSVVTHKYCLVLSDDFSQGFRSDVWTKEVQVGGFGNGEFEQTTADDENVFVRDGKLWIMATLQDAALVEQDSVIDLAANGSCTSTAYADCVAATNTTAGNSSIVPPARSGRITTKTSASIRYGRVEVTARLPKGDWLWPAIWMMPVNDTYGAWPASGEIDLMESRGNNNSYVAGGGGYNIMSSALHWGPAPAYDAWWRTNNKRSALHTTFADGFNTFGLEWSDKYLFTYVNSRLLQALYINFDTPMWKRGNFPRDSAALAASSSIAKQGDSNNNNNTNSYTNVDNAWAQTGRPNTPFDTPFYLILNLAVGGTNGWFGDNEDGKPWLDGSDRAKLDFWNARDQWQPTWTQPQLEISKVQMWQQCDGNEEL